MHLLGAEKIQQWEGMEDSKNKYIKKNHEIDIGLKREGTNK